MREVWLLHLLDGLIDEGVSQSRIEVARNWVPQSDSVIKGDGQQRSVFGERKGARGHLTEIARHLTTPSFFLTWNSKLHNK